MCKKILMFLFCCFLQFAEGAGIVIHSVKIGRDSRMKYYLTAGLMIFNEELIKSLQTKGSSIAVSIATPSA